MTQGFFLASGAGWAIDVANFVLSQCFDNSEIRRRPIVENGEIIELLEQALHLEAVDWLWRGAVSGGSCFHS